MRHLLVILARAPWFFVNLGFFLGLLSALIAIGCLLGPRTVMGRFALFDYHTLILAAIMGFFGSQILSTGLTLNLSGKHQMGRLATALVSLERSNVILDALWNVRGRRFRSRVNLLGLGEPRVRSRR